MKIRTKVMFRKWRGGEIGALFPELPGTRDPRTCLNYFHNGQHGHGNAMLTGTVAAVPEEYAGLEKELTQRGYDLDIVSRFTPEMHRNRKAAIA